MFVVPPSGGSFEAASAADSLTTLKHGERLPPEGGTTNGIQIEEYASNIRGYLIVDV